jgi:hypothetical protein
LINHEPKSENGKQKERTKQEEKLTHFIEEEGLACHLWWTEHLSLWMTIRMGVRERLEIIRRKRLMHVWAWLESTWTTHRRHQSDRQLQKKKKKLKKIQDVCQRPRIIQERIHARKAFRMVP